MTAMERLQIPELLSALPDDKRDLVAAMTVNRVIRPFSKLACTTWWNITTLPQYLDLQDVDAEDLYDAMDSLYEQQPVIEQKLAERHLKQGDFVFYDLSSSYMEGKNCPLATFGYSRDKKKGKLQINYGLLTDKRGCPVKIEVFPGNTSDTKTFVPMAEKVRNEFKLNKFIIVGDRGMMGTNNIEVLKSMGNIDWISALKSVSIRTLVEKNDIIPGFDDETNLIELHAPNEYPGERLIFCRNTFLAAHRRKSRNDLLDATEKILIGIKTRVDSGTLKGIGAINMAIGRVIDKYKMKKHFILNISDNSFDYSRDTAKIQAEEFLDGIYVVRTSLKSEDMTGAECVRGYKRLTNVERAFRTIKTSDIKIRPIYHHLEGRVKAHIFICMLSYYIYWHMKEAWRELTFADENTESHADSDPVEPARRSDEALSKIKSKKNASGETVTSFQSLLCQLSAHVRSNQVINLKGSRALKYQIDTNLTLVQEKALRLIGAIKM
jgi:transposase